MPQQIRDYLHGPNWQRGGPLDKISVAFAKGFTECGDAGIRYTSLRRFPWIFLNYGALFACVAWNPTAGIRFPLVNLPVVCADRFWEDGDMF